MASTLLYGSDRTQRVVAVEPKGFGTVEIYRREKDVLTVEERQFRPWLLSPVIVPDVKASWRKLSGKNHYQYMAKFFNWQSYKEAAGMEDKDFFSYKHPVKQFMSISGMTLFKGMSFDDVHRLTFDIETTGFSPEKDEIILIALKDNSGFKQVIEGSEEWIIRHFIELVRMLDPDVLQGHNLYGFDLPFLMRRAEINGWIPLAIGRDGSEPKLGRERSSPIGGISRPFVPVYVHGRHIIDTLLGVQRYDVVKGRLSSYALKPVCQEFGIASKDRVYIPGDEIAEVFEKDPQSVKTYALQDVEETERLAKMVGPSEFYLTQMVPESYQSVATGGTGGKVESLIIREYLRQGSSIPLPKMKREFVGGYTEVKRTGLIERVVKCDVESLYPSLMLTFDIHPKDDHLGVFIPMLRELTAKRIEAKGKMKASKDKEREYWDGLQNSFKILINSFYGFMGGPFHFNDTDAAEKVTTGGQDIVKKIAKELERTGSSVIEIDTDGVYFTPPDTISDSEDAEEFYIGRINEILPTGIRLAHDGRYKAMISLKRKNYILVAHDGKKTFKGASLRSRADEKFGRLFIAQVVDHILEGEREKIKPYYLRMIDMIHKRAVGVENIVRRERVSEKTYTSKQKRKMKRAVDGTPVGDYVGIYRKEDGELAKMEEYLQNESTDHIAQKLYKFALRLSPAFSEEEFKLTFPRPNKLMKAEAYGQEVLFG